jgi:hypothetical protein
LIREHLKCYELPLWILCRLPKIPEIPTVRGYPSYITLRGIVLTCTIFCALEKQTCQRISKACQECRRRKKKCDGASTCRNCQLTSTTCNYRLTARNRKRAKGVDIEQQQQRSISNEGNRSPNTSSLTLGGQQQQQQQLPLSKSQASLESSRHIPQHSSISNVQNTIFQSQDDHPGTLFINRSISATHIASPSCVLQLYYGASSNFSFLQQIHQKICGSATNSRPGNDVEEAGPGLDFYGQRSLFFGTPNSSYQQNNLLGFSSLTLLSEQLAESFLQDYLGTLYHLHPFQAPEELCHLVKSMFEKPQDEKQGSERTATLMVVLAIGATMTNNTAWGEMLTEKAKNVMNAQSHVVNLQAVQLALLLICSPPDSLCRNAANFTSTLITSISLVVQTPHTCIWEQVCEKHSQQVFIEKHKSTRWIRKGFCCSRRDVLLYGLFIALNRERSYLYIEACSL